MTAARCGASAPAPCSDFDVILNIGQSNSTSRGFPNTSPYLIDISNIFQLGRDPGFDYRGIVAEEPLHHYSGNGIGFSAMFAKLYAERFLSSNRNLIIIPAGYGGSGFKSGRDNWNPGDPQYIDAISRANAVLNSFPNSELVAILWHQGESDRNNPNYKMQLDNMINQMRLDIAGASSVPFLLGELSKLGIATTPERGPVNDIILDTPNRLTSTAVALSTSVTTESEVIIGSTDRTHFSAPGMLKLGQRYFCAWDKLANGGTPSVQADPECAFVQY